MEDLSDNKTAKNDITGDVLKSKGLSKQGRDNFDAIDWGGLDKKPSKKEKDVAANK